MCGIVFKKASLLKDYFSIAHQRGLDGFGFINSRGQIGKRFANSLSTFLKTSGKEFSFYVDEKATTYASYKDFYNRILLSVVNQYNDEYLLLHHRKATSGGKSINNCHPFVGDKYIVMQNGSTKEFSDWGKIEFGVEDKPDTHYIGQWINRMGSLEEVEDRLLKLPVSVGVVMVYDKASKSIMYFGDGDRSFYFNIVDGKIDYCGSLTEDGKDNFINEGVMVFDFEGNIIKNSIVSLNKENKKTYTPAQYRNTEYSTYSTYSTYYSNDYDSRIDPEDFDNYYYKYNKKYEWDFVRHRYVMVKEENKSTQDGKRVYIKKEFDEVTTKEAGEVFKQTKIEIPDRKLEEKIAQFNNLVKRVEKGGVKEKKRKAMAKKASNIYADICELSKKSGEFLNTKFISLGVYL